MAVIPKNACDQHPWYDGKSQPPRHCLECWETYLGHEAREFEEITAREVLGYGRALRQWVKQQQAPP